MFDIFWAGFPPLRQLRWNFTQPSGPRCPLAVPNLTWIGATSRPCGAKNLIFGLWVNLIPAGAASGAGNNNNSNTEYIIFVFVDYYTISVNIGVVSSRAVVVSIDHVLSCCYCICNSVKTCSSNLQCDTQCITSNNISPSLLIAPKPQMSLGQVNVDICQ